MKKRIAILFSCFVISSCSYMNGPRITDFTISIEPLSFFECSVDGTDYLIDRKKTFTFTGDLFPIVIVYKTATITLQENECRCTILFMPTEWFIYDGGNVLIRKGTY